MPVIQNLVSVPANGVVDNVLAGSQFEFLPYNALLEFGFQGGTGGPSLRIDAFSGQDILCEGMSCSAAARFPVYPDDYSLNDAAAAGERLKVRVRNTSGAAVDFYYSIKIAPI